jgi:ssDNA-binding Zn-finger/Zn-ribbon topoisomerase 1
MGKTGLVDIRQPGANMYGCQPCPKCRATYRYPRFDAARTVGTIHCDDCGYTEPWTDAEAVAAVRGPGGNP